jgi:4-amino-4-deoxy-L-arabinose transferase-like glycosyltransferase
MSTYKKDVLLISSIAAVFFLPFLGGVHLFDWDEINFAEIAREMVVLGDYLRIHVDFIPFTEKPPFFFWLQALSMEVFGIGEYAARFPNAVCGVITLPILYAAGRKIKDRKLGWLWAGAYFGSVLPHLYFKSGIIDPWFNLFIFLGLFFLILIAQIRRDPSDSTSSNSAWKNLLLAGIFTGLAVLTKGPVAILITALTVGIYIALNRFRFFVGPAEIAIYGLITIAVTLLWYGIETLVHGPTFIVEFTIRQWEMFSTPDAGHKGFPGYHFIVLLIGCFPASIFLIRAHGRLALSDERVIDFKKWMMILFWVVLILFTIVKSKIVHYSSMAYFPLSFLAALVIYQLWEKQIEWKKWMSYSLLGISGLLGVVIILFPFAGMNPEVILPLFSKDRFAMGNLEADIHWTGFEAICGVLFLGIIWRFLWLRRQGNWKRGVITLFGGMGVFVFVTLVLFIAKIEGYSQNAAIEFYKSKQDCDCYVVPERFKSYGQLFYARTPRDKRPESRDMEWLKRGPIDKDVFFVAKITGTEELQSMEEVEFLYEKNGFTFWKRPVPKSSL